MSGPSASLVLERHDRGLRLYLGGDLQFDTADEAIYHERLAHPALMVARCRFTEPLDVLVLGGGDGLLVRELLRHEGIGSVQVVDLDPRILALARSELAAHNAASLDDPRVRVTVADAREVLDGSGRFHAIFSDLTYPGSLDDCALYTRDWLTRLRSHLQPGGLVALNAVSPDQTPSAYWCVYQTLRLAGLETLPGHFHLPSFAELGYGSWGFFLASERAIEPGEFQASLPEGLRTLDRDGLRACFRLPTVWAEARNRCRPAIDGGRTLFEALLDATPTTRPIAEETALDFLGFNDPVAVPEATERGVVQHPRFREWLARRPGSGIDDLLAAVPLSHRIVTRALIHEWSSYLIQVLPTLDLRRLVSAVLRRASRLPRRMVQELRGFRALLARGLNPADDLPTWGWRFFSVLMLVLVLSQTALPTAAYAKGGVYSGSSHSYSSGFRPSYFGSGGHHRVGSRSSSPEDEEMMRKIFGGLLLAGGLGVTAYSARRKPE